MNSLRTSSPCEEAHENIKVYARLRHDENRLHESTDDFIVISNEAEITIKKLHDGMDGKFLVDQAFDIQSDQCEVFTSVMLPLIDELITGYDCTVMTYGQSGTGKSFTMFGKEKPSDAGIIPQTTNHLFDHVLNELSKMGAEFVIKVSYFELCNEEFYDMLTSDNANIIMFDDMTKEGSVVLYGLQEITVRNKSDVYKLLAERNKRKKQTRQNSPVHTIFSIILHFKEYNVAGEEMLKSRKLTFVDLAGGDNENIDKSLRTLENVVQCLTTNQPQDISYNGSKLTRLLKDCFGGRTKTAIIATLSPDYNDLDETVNTLEFAFRTKCIHNKPKINQQLTKSVVLEEYEKNFDTLKSKLIADQSESAQTQYLQTDTDVDLMSKMESQVNTIREKMNIFKALREAMQNKSRMFDECQETWNSSLLITVEQNKSSLPSVSAVTDMVFSDVQSFVDDDRVDNDIPPEDPFRKVPQKSSLDSNIENLYKRFRIEKSKLPKTSSIGEYTCEKERNSIEYPFECKLCGRSFKLKRALQRHTATVHGNKKAFKCNICEKTFARRDYLAEHLTNVHVTSKHFKCKICGISVASNGYLKRHITNVHEKKKPFSCATCKQTFSRKGSLAGHIKAIHSALRP